MFVFFDMFDVFVYLNHLFQTSRAFSTAPNVHHSIKGVRRFYQNVSYEESETDPGHFEIFLDGRLMRTPARNPLLVSFSLSSSLKKTFISHLCVLSHVICVYI